MGLGQSGGGREEGRGGTGGTGVGPGAAWAGPVALFLEGWSEAAFRASESRV